jgi:hypothetical protein
MLLRIVLGTLINADRIFGINHNPAGLGGRVILILDGSP